LGGSKAVLAAAVFWLLRAAAQRDFRETAGFVTLTAFLGLEQDARPALPGPDANPQKQAG
jgi:hypothetical protein